MVCIETIDADEGVKASLKRRDPPENDTSEPKKPESAYAFYCAERIPAIKAGHPEMSLAEINTTTLSEWNDLPTDKKQVAILLFLVFIILRYTCPTCTHSGGYNTWPRS